MPEENKSVKIRVRSGDSEAEVETSLANIREAIDLIPEVIARLPKSSAPPRSSPPSSPGESAISSGVEHAPPAMQAPAAPSALPAVTVEKGDSLSDVISKFFSDAWGRSPKKLMEVREALQSYGLNYPKQSVAVALLRLAKGSKLRRFKGEGGEYVYTASTGVARLPVQVPVPASPQEAAPALEEGEEQEEQLDLDAPATN